MASPARSFGGGGAAAAAAPAAEAQTCPLCFEPFETQKPAAAAAGVQSDRRPRVLACGHSFCGACLHADMQQRRCCAMCKQGIAYADAVAVPINFSLIAAIERAAQSAAHVAALQRQVAEAHEQSRPKCAECGALPTLYCAECGDHGFLCAAHSQHVHSLQRNKEHLPFIVPFAEKAAAIAAKAQRGALTKCAKHPKQEVELFCTYCNVAVCLLCVHGSKHTGHVKIEIDEAAAKVRAEQLARQYKMMWPGGNFRSATRLTAQLRRMKEVLAESSEESSRAIDGLIAEVKAAAVKRGDELKQQLKHKREAADVVIDNLLVASSATAAAEAQLSTALSEADGSNHHETLAKAPQIAQHFADVEVQLRDLDQLMASDSSRNSCVTKLKLSSDAKAALLLSLSQLGSFDPETVELHGSTAAGSRELQVPSEELAPLIALQSHILPPDKYADLKGFFGQTQMPRKLLYRATRDGFELKDWKARCAGKGPTMTLAKVDDNGFVFGAYAHCSWPEGGGQALDPSGSSFLFSLVHETTKSPIRLAQRDLNKPAIGPLPGVDMCNFTLMFNSLSATHPQGNLSWKLSQEGYNSFQPDNAALGDGSFNLGTTHGTYFACEEIEVYEADSDHKTPEVGAAAASGASGLKRPLARDDSSSSSAANSSLDSSAHKRQKKDQ